NRASVCGVDQLTTPASHLNRGDQVPARPNLATGRGASVGASTDREPVRDASRMRGGSVRAHGAVTRPISESWSVSTAYLTIIRWRTIWTVNWTRWPLAWARCS